MELTERFERIEERWHLTIEKDRIKSISFSREVGRAVRVIVDGKAGFASAVGKGFEEIENAAKKLIKISGEELDSFPCPKKLKVPKIYDCRVEDFSPEDLKSLGDEMLESVKKCSIASGVLDVERVETTIENPEFQGSYAETTSFAFVEVVGDGNAYSYAQSRKLDMDVEKVVNEAEELAKKPVESVSGDMEVVLSPVAVNQLLSYTLYPAFSAENVVKGRSPVKAGIDFGWNFRVFDDPALDWGLNSYPFDDEGAGATTRELYSEGVKSLLSNWRFSKIMKVPPGNALREESTSYPAIAPSNVVLDIEVDRSAELNGEDSGVLYVHSLVGAHTANPVSGDFSVECNNAFLRGKPVRAMLYGNVYEVLKHVVCQSKPRQVDNTVCGNVLFEKGAFSVV